MSKKPDPHDKIIEEADYNRLAPNCKLDANMIKTLRREIIRGLPIGHARKIAGISASAYKNWYDKGSISEDPKDPYKVFYEEIEYAKAIAIGKRVDAIRKAGEEPKNWQANAWWLERVDPKNFGIRSVIDANIDSNVKQVDLSELFDKDELKKIIKEDEDNPEEY